MAPRPGPSMSGVCPSGFTELCRKPTPSGYETAVFYTRKDAGVASKMQNFAVIAILFSLLISSVSVSESAHWQILDSPAIRVHYQSGNGSEAQLLTQAGGPVLQAVEQDLGLKVSGPLEVRILPPRGDKDRKDGAPHWAVGYVTGGSTEVILRGNWVRTYPFGDLLSLFAHETTHALLNTLPA